MVGMIFGAIVGGAVVWFWRDQIASQLGQKTHAVRAKAAEGLEVVEKQTEALLDRAKPQITSALRAGKEAIRPSGGEQSQGQPGAQSHGREPFRRAD
jgi:gas vesicle protein